MKLSLGGLCGVCSFIWKKKAPQQPKVKSEQRISFPLGVTEGVQARAVCDPLGREAITLYKAGGLFKFRGIGIWDSPISSWKDSICLKNPNCPNDSIDPQNAPLRMVVQQRKLFKRT